MAKISAKQNQINDLYAKERRRIQRFIKSAEKRGYTFEYQIPKIPKKKTMGSVRRLQRTTTETLYAKATFVDTNTGEIVSGKQGRNIENQRRSEKSARTRKLNLAPVKKSKETTPAETIETEQITETEKIATQKKKEDLTPAQSVEQEEKEYREQKRKSDVNAPSWNEIIIANFKAHVLELERLAGKRKADRTQRTYGGVLLQWIDRLVADNGKQAVAEMLEAGANAGIVLDYKVVYDEKLCHEFMSAMIDFLPDVGNMYKEEIEDLTSEWETVDDFM